MKRFITKKRAIFVSAMAFVLVVSLIIPFVSSAKMVDVYTKSSENEHLPLDWVTIYSPDSPGYRPTGKMVSQAAGSYSIETNSWGSWFAADATHFVCTKAPFNTGEESVLTIQATFDSIFNYKQFGIMVRKSLDADSESCWLNFDADRVRIDYREKKAEDCTWAKTNYKVDTSKKIHVKVVIQKKRGIVEFYNQLGDSIADDKWQKLTSKSISFLKSSSEFYVGVCVAAEAESQTTTATFSNFSVNLQAPEGYKIEDGTDDDGENTKPSEPEVDLPEDLAAAGDALLYETFTDGDIFPAEDKISISNPLWTVRTGEPEIALDESKKNRYLLVNIGSDPVFMETGDMEWTDYSMQAEFTFPEDTMPEEMNRVEFLVRERSAYVGGLGYYGVALYNKYKDGFLEGQYLVLETKQGITKSWTDTTNSLILKEVKIADQSMISYGTTHTIKVEVFDNTIKVYLDDLTNPMIDYTDTRTGSSRVQDPHLMGGIGLLITEASVKIDNIVVRKLYDPLGGDYDNMIMGDYDQPIPEWIEKDYMK